MADKLDDLSEALHLAMADWRYAVRVATIDTSGLEPLPPGDPNHPFSIAPGSVNYVAVYLSAEEIARRKAKNKRRAATRFRAREFRRMQADIAEAAAAMSGGLMLVPYSEGELRRLADASVSAADRPAGPAASVAEVSPVPEAADIEKISAAIIKMMIPPREWFKLEPSKPDYLAAIREIARK